ncbi:IgGFc-binding protein [Pseudenhygromyxa sp. WMMC2535]|uniref:IgGFc-binding protein n=1 Tax=Pseudenhygromyxa sp. WMMC2535 TaxID=2712867 RepID=UPI0031F84610
MTAACSDDSTDGSADEAADSTADSTADTDTTMDSGEGSTSMGTTETDSDDDITADTTADSTTADTTADSTDMGETTADTTADETTDTTDTTEEGPFCQPGSSVCADASSVQTCLDDGSAYGDPVPCEDTEECSAGACVPQCELIQANPSSIGCSFFANRMDNYSATENDSLVVGNISSDTAVTAQLYFVPNNSSAEQAQGSAVEIAPEGTYTFTLTNAQIESTTTVRQGGVYRLETNLPVVAYQHSPIGSVYTNDASMLLPEHALTGNYVVSSYPATIGSYPSYFTAIAIADGTTVDFTVPEATAGGGGVSALAAGESTQVMLDRYDTLNVVVSQQTGGDLSGTVISSDQPLWLVGATECANVPNSATALYCDHMEEAILPLEYWGQEYVGPHAPYRSGNEDFHWRVYSGEDGVTITTDPVQTGFPVQLDKGEYYQFSTDESFVVTGDGPFMPVQYLEGTTGGANDGDPSMYQMVPTAQFLDTYAFVTGEDYPTHWAQIIRPAGGSDVSIDGTVVGGYYTVGSYEVADVSISEGSHFATSDQPFGIISVGYSPATSYAYPGGLKLEVINPQ